MLGMKIALGLILLSVFFAASSAYTTRMYAPAVFGGVNGILPSGNLTLVQLNVTPGKGSVSINGPSNVASTTIASAQTAAVFAASFLGLKETSYNFNFTIFDRNDSVSGPSGGLAFTLLSIAALQRKQLPPNFTSTGTISKDGSVGAIGGVFDKVSAAKAGGMKYILVPYAPSGSFEYLLYYISQQVWGLPIIPVSNASQAVQYVFGQKALNPVQPNFSTIYDAGSIGLPNVTCGGCNTSAFSYLANFTLNVTSATELNISSDFGAARQQFINNLNTYRGMAAKGYLYTAADFSFLDFLSAFTLTRSQYYNASQTPLLISNVSSYCSSLVAPQMTDKNYEFVLGGQLRQYWANVTIANAWQQLNSSETTDEAIQSVYTTASALGWCGAADEQYSIADYIGGNPVQTSPSLRAMASDAISKVRSQGGSGLYVQAASQAFNSGDYAAALLSATYANVFGPGGSTTSMNDSQIYSASLRNINKATTGVWPYELALQSEFYLGQMPQASGNSTAKSDLVQAYSTALLASSLQSAENSIAKTFQPYAGGTVPSSISEQISSMQQSISQLYQLLLINVALLFIVLVVLLVKILPQGKGRKPINRNSANSG